MQQRHRLAPAPHGHHQRIGHELRGHAVLHRPANDATRVQVQHRSGIQPALGRPDVGEVGHPLLVGRIGLELTVQHVVGDGAALASVLRQASTPWPRAQGLFSHEPFNAMQSASLTQCKHVMPHAPGAIGAVAAHKALAHLAAEHLVDQTALAPGPAEPRVEATSRDTERLAHHCQRPRPSVFRHEAELHIDSLAK
jgi:hypothetical protein